MSLEEVNTHLSKVQPDFLIAEAGSVELSAVTKAISSLKQVIWVAKPGNRHMDWSEVPAGIGGKVGVTTWHELVDDKKESVSSEVPASDKDSKVEPLVTFWPTSDGSVGEPVEYTSSVRPHSLQENRFLVG